MEEENVFDALDKEEFEECGSRDAFMALKPDDTPPIVPIQLEELRLHQQRDLLYQRIAARLGKEENSIRFWARRSPILVRAWGQTDFHFIPTPNPVLHLVHYGKLRRHPGGRRLYVYLKGLFYWPMMAVDCYAVERDCVSFAKSRVLLRRHLN